MRFLIGSAILTLFSCSSAVAQSDASGEPTKPPTILMENVGFLGSECVRYDAVADVYLVTNLGERGEQGDGFVTKVSPEGEVLDLKWIEGGLNGVELSDPLGLFIQGERVYVADAKAIHIFDRKSGNPLESIEIPDAARLNDLTVAQDGTIYVTDSGSDERAGAIYVVRGRQVAPFVARDDALERPNGIALMEDGTVVHGGRGVNLVFRNPDGEIMRERSLPTGRMDGIIPLADDALLVASQDGHAVYRVPSGGPVEVVADGIPVPAAIGWDSTRNRLLVPQIRLASLAFYPLD